MAGKSDRPCVAALGAGPERRHGEEHRQLQWGDIALLADENGREYLEYNERGMKKKPGEFRVSYTLHNFSLCCKFFYLVTLEFDNHAVIKIL